MAHQDNRFPGFKRLNVTELYRDLNKFEERVKKQSTRSLVVLRGLPGSGKTDIANKFTDAEIFHLDDYIPKGKDDLPIYDMANIKLGNLAIRKKINKLLKTKFNKPIVVNAPHVYLWELKYFKAIACQSNIPLIIYEARTLFSKEAETRAKQLDEININEMIGEVRKWLAVQRKKTVLLETQQRLLDHLHSGKPEELGKKKDKTNSFCPNILLNIQLAAWLTKRCKQNVFMDTIWHFIQEWEEIQSEESMWKVKTPKWGW